MINSIEDLSALIRSGVRDFSEYGQVKTQEHEGLIQFSYSKECNFKPPAEWSYFERISRGLILDSITGEVRARPFDKFWNYGQVLPEKDDEIESITQKMDGSLGISYPFYGYKGDHFRVATRGSFTSDQALWATDFLSRHTGLIPDWYNPRLTYLFEIIYPENRVVVDYGNLSTLVLIGVRDVVTGEEYSYSMLHTFARYIDLTPPKNYLYASVEEAAEAAAKLGPNEEGFVIRFKSGLRLKVKSEEYLKLHRFVNEFSVKAVAQALLEGRIMEVAEVCPSNYTEKLIRNVVDITTRVGQIEWVVDVAHYLCDKYAREVGSEHGARDYKKYYAEYVFMHYAQYSQYLFARRDGKLIQDMIYKKEWGVQ